MIPLEKLLVSIDTRLYASISNEAFSASQIDAQEILTLIAIAYGNALTRSKTLNRHPVEEKQEHQEAIPQSTPDREGPLPPDQQEAFRVMATR